MYSCKALLGSVLRSTGVWVLPLTYPERVAGLGSGVAPCCTPCRSCEMQTARVRRALRPTGLPWRSFLFAAPETAVVAFSALRNHLDKKGCIGICGAIAVPAIILLKYSKSQASHAEVKSTECLKTNKQARKTQQRKKPQLIKITCIFWAVCHFKIVMEVTGLEWVLAL